MFSRPVRILAAVSLPLTALLSIVSVVTQPEFTSNPVARLGTLDAAGTSATVSALTFVLSQLPFVVAVVAIAALTHARAPRVSWTGGVLGVLGGFGHTVFGGLALSYLALAADSGHREVLGHVVTRVEAGPVQPFMAIGLIGTVLGLVLLGVALFRSRVVPRWIPVALWVFVVLEFALSNIAAWASLVAGLVYLAACTGIAVQLVRGFAQVGSGIQHELPVPALEA
jgi:hypothetical protein